LFKVSLLQNRIPAPTMQLVDSVWSQSTTCTSCVESSEETEENGGHRSLPNFTW